MQLSLETVSAEHFLCNRFAVTCPDFDLKAMSCNLKVGCIHIQLDHMIIAKIHLLPAAMTARRLLQIPSARTFRNLS
jgi:hypothetical protein